MLDSLGTKRIRDKIKEDIISGLKTSEIIKSVQTITGISDRMAYKHLKKVKDAWIKQRETERPYDLVEAINIKKKLFSEAYLDKDLRLANDIHNDECKIKGIYSPIQVQDTTTQPLTINIQIVNQ